VVERDTLTIRQAAALLNVHPNTVRNRIKSGVYQAGKVITERGETYMIARSELARDLNTNKLPNASQSQSLPDVRETIQAMLEPFVRELGDVREELGRERERRERAEAELQALRQERESPVSDPGPGSARAPTNPDEGAHSEAQATESPQAQETTGSSERPWWRRIFGG